MYRPSGMRFKGFLSLILVLMLICMSVIPIIAQEEEPQPLTSEDEEPQHDGPPYNAYTFSGGKGTAQDPYIISTVDDLLAFIEAVKDGNYAQSSYRLTANIDLGDNLWTFPFNDSPSFAGTFDGNGKKITIRKIADSAQMGLFSSTGREALIKDLTVNAQISKSLSTSGDTYFGLIVARGEGRIVNCITEGKVDLTVSGPGEFSFGGITGRFEGSIDNAMNKAALTINKNGDGWLMMGGITGVVMGDNTRLSSLTNQGSISAVCTGRANIGGLAGFCGLGAEAENLLNMGNITLKQTAASNSSMSFAGGVLGELRDSQMDKALNKGNIFLEYTGSFVEEEIAAGGVAGTAEHASLKNVGNEGNVETKSARFQHAIGIAKPGRDARIENAYSWGRIYGSSTQAKAELYVMGLGEEVAANNFYFAGTVRFKAGNKQEVDGDALANIRPGTKTNIYNYCYWNSSIAPFTGYPTFNKPASTSKAVNVNTGKLASSVSINGKNYDTLSSALNAWVAMQKGGYLSWTADAKPVFDWTFGYQIPDYMKYKNSREGKWLNTSDWAYEWMDKADKLDIIPDILLNQDITKGITRKEFSALAVKLYENLKGSKAEADIENPFTDINDPDVIKAYSLDIVTGMGNKLFAPDQVLTREQASTMLTRVYKAVYWEGWTLKGDGAYNIHVLDTTGISKFSDDYLISDYARDSVYFMAKNNIVGGLGSNLFGPAPAEGKDANYGKATREQAFKMAAAMIEKFK
jgi:hypothetical protein